MTRKGQRIILKKPVGTQDATGQAVIVDTQYGPARWADVRDVAGGEVIRRGQVDAIVGGVVRIDYPREGRIPQPEDQIVFTELGPNGETRTVEIIRVTRVGNRQRELDLYFKEDA